MPKDYFTQASVKFRENKLRKVLNMKINNLIEIYSKTMSDVNPESMIIPEPANPSPIKKKHVSPFPFKNPNSAIPVLESPRNQAEMRKKKFLSTTEIIRL